MKRIVIVIAMIVGLTGCALSPEQQREEDIRFISDACSKGNLSRVEPNTCLKTGLQLLAQRRARDAEIERECDRYADAHTLTTAGAIQLARLCRQRVEYEIENARRQNR